MKQRIVFKNEDGSCGILIPSQNCVDKLTKVKGVGVVAALEAIARKDVPEGLAYRITTVADLPSDRLFRNAWTDDNDTNTVDIDLSKAKEITHGKRRTKREKEFAPHDKVIMKQIPGDDMAMAEEARSAVRGKFDQMQLDIDGCFDEAGLRNIIETESL